MKESVVSPNSLFLGADGTLLYHMLLLQTATLSGAGTLSYDVVLGMPSQGDV